MTAFMNDVKKDGIRCEMNLIFSLMRLLSTILDMAPNSEPARSTANSVADRIWEQAAALRFEVDQYITALNDEGVQGPVPPLKESGEEDA